MNKKIKIELAFCDWRNINVMIFDIVVTVDEVFIFDGVMFFDVRRNSHIIDDQLIYMLRQKNINKEIIIKALGEKNYSFEINKTTTLKEKIIAQYEETVVDENYDYSWDKEEEEKVMEAYPNMVFDFG
jgi:hypothetical protein